MLSTIELEIEPRGRIDGCCALGEDAGTGAEGLAGAADKVTRAAQSMSTTPGVDSKNLRRLTAWDLAARLARAVNPAGTATIARDDANPFRSPESAGRAYMRGAE